MNDYSSLPSIEKILSAPENQGCVAAWGYQSARDAVRQLQQQMRTSARVPDWAGSAEGYTAPLQQLLKRKFGQGLQRVFNLSGTLIHTNLGRSRLSPQMVAGALAAASQAVTLEFDLSTGKRGQRDLPVEQLICTLTGAEAATIVNNNAAALMLILNTLALHREVPVSRGELIEIGGSFRLPDIMARSGCTLVEIGTTNRTHVSDYQNALAQKTLEGSAAAESDRVTETASEGPAMLLKIHPSNYCIEGFTKDVSIAELSAVARENGLPLCVDLGSGALLDLSRYGLPREATVQNVLKQGADLVCFSGDKLIGSVQAGIVAGRKDLIEKLRRNPMKRALRCDKLTLGILAETFKAYQQPETLLENIPMLKMMSRSVEELRPRAEQTQEILRQQLDQSFLIDICDCQCQIGSGALPDKTLDSLGVRIRAVSVTESIQLLKRLRALTTPVIGRINQNAVWLDMRGLMDAQETRELLTTLAEL